METTTQQRLKDIMAERKLKQKDICALAEKYCKKFGEKLTASDVSAYVTGKWEPAQRKITILALALDVSEGWLMGMDVPMERQKSSNEIAENLNNDDAMKLFEALTKENKEKMIDYMKYLLSTQK